MTERRPSPEAVTGPRKKTSGAAGNRLVERLTQLRSAGRRGLAPYVTAGDGGLATTLSVLRALDAAGATCVELGVPFSDPIADGPVLQAAAQRALKGGTTLAGVLDVIDALRTGRALEHGEASAPSDLPIVVMTYANPLLRLGWDGAARELARAGADGLLVADLPVEEGEPMARAARDADLCPIFFAAPTTSDARLARAVALSRGFLYAIGRFGVTGSATAFDEQAQSFLARVRVAAGDDLAVAVGFGIRSAEDVTDAVRHADVAIVGTALVQELHESTRSRADRERPAAAAERAHRFLASLIEGLSP